MPMLGETGVSTEFIVDKLQQNEEKKIKANQAQVKVIGEEGFLSNIFKVAFEWELPTQLPNSVVVKIPTVDKFGGGIDVIDLDDEAKKYREKHFTEQMDRDFIAMSHETEIKAYNILSKQTDGLPIPKFYYGQPCQANDRGILIMEDFSDRVTMVGLKEGLNLKQILAVVEQLALVHAYSLGLPSGWEKPFQDNGKERMKMIDVFVNHMKHVAFALKKLQPDPFEKLVDQAAQYFTVDEFLKAFISPKWLGLPDVLVQGDMWVCNLLWSKDAAGQPTDNLLAIIDWQSSHPGNCAEDIARLLATSVCPKIRRQDLDTILAHYHTTLCAKLGYEPYSVEMVHRSYEAILPYATLAMSFGVPLMLGSLPEVKDEQHKKRMSAVVLKRTEAFYEDFITSQNSFAPTFMERFRWFGIKAVMWILLKLG